MFRSLRLLALVAAPLGAQQITGFTAASVAAQRAAE